MDRYPPIADHGLVGDLQTAALVSSQGVVDWFAAPRFDSPSIFAALLDHDRGGYLRLAPERPDATCKQLYYPDTAILVTRFLSPDGVGEVLDFMPPDRTRTATDRHTLVRGIRAVRGTVDFTLECSTTLRLRPSRARTRTRRERRSVPGPRTRRAPAVHLPAGAGRPGCPRKGDAARRRDRRCRVHRLRVRRRGARTPTVDGLNGQFEDVALFWRHWLRQSHYRGRWPERVHRSAITLKLLTYAPTGALIAAATTGLPEQVGGERNWDYRFTWIRDGSLSVRAMLDLGFVEEATAFVHWLTDRLREREGKEEEPLQTMYRIDGNPDLPEETLDHFEGYRGSYPVRIGNGAADQLQLDIYGEALYAVSQGAEIAQQASFEGWQAMARTLDWFADAWDRPDEGIWETRGGRQDFTYSRVMSWVALDHGLRLAESFRRPADLERWRKARDAVFEQIMERGWSEQERAFVQHYDGEVLDASLLLMPRVGFIAPRDRAWLSTLDAMDRKLVSDSLVYRYDPAASPDGLRGSEGTFSMCTFLYVDALARAGRLSQARYTFEKMQTYANHVGLFAEEIGPSGEQLGNFPQAFTHLSLIMAAITLDEALDAEERR